MDPFTYSTRLAASWAMSAQTARHFAEAIEAAGTVIDARSRTIHDAMASPWDADHRELSRMWSEKVAPFASASTIVTRAWAEAIEGWWGFLDRSNRLLAAGRWPTPGETMEYWSRAAMDGLHAAETASRAGRDALAPIHRTAIANARRLGAR